MPAHWHRPRAAFPTSIVRTGHGERVTLPCRRLCRRCADLSQPRRRSSEHRIVGGRAGGRRIRAEIAYVDAESIVVYGCSGGGDLALEVAARTKIAVVVPEEPASVLMAGMFNSNMPKKGERYTADDGFFLFDNPRQYYTPEFHKILRARIAKIQCP